MRTTTFLLSFLIAGILTGCSSNSRLHWVRENGYRWASVNPGYWGSTGFKELSAKQTGIDFVNHLPDSLIKKNHLLLNGSGVAAGDVNGDGLVDLYFTQLDGPNKLYENLGGMHFKDITASAGVALPDQYSTGAVFADVDGDGDLDLLVTSLNKDNVLFINDGHGHFHRSTDSGLGPSHGATTLTLADIDGDGDLDLYIANYRKKSVTDTFNMDQLTWKETTRKVGDKYELIPPFQNYFTIIYRKNRPPIRQETGEQDELYLNNGKGVFKKVTDLKHHFLNADGKPEGLKKYWGLTAKFFDLNGDGKPDLYVCNDFWSPDQIWINQGGGIFKKLNPKSIRNMSFSSMSMAVSDINRDGYPDIFVTEMLSPNHQNRLREAVPEVPFSMGAGIIFNQPQYNRNSLYLNREDTTFAEISNYSGVAATGWSWATKFLDVDLDGYEDLLVNTGNQFDLQDLDTQDSTYQKMLMGASRVGKYLSAYPPLRLTNKVYHNNGDLTFTDKSKDWGFHDADVSQGMATGDLDNDGDIDLAINRLNQKAVIYENTTNAPRIEVRLKGLPPNTQAIGAKIKLTGAKVPQQEQLLSGGDYESGSDPEVTFAANGKSNNYTLFITWPGGSKTKIDSVKKNRIYEVYESKTDNTDQDKQVKTHHVSVPKPWFKDVSNRVDFIHHEDVFKDFQVQPLLPERLSQEGPGLAWIDYNGDGYDDLWITSGKGGETAVFKNTGDGHFHQVKLPPVNHKANVDQTAVIGWKDGHFEQIAVGNANFENGSPDVPSAYLYKIAQGTNKVEADSLNKFISTTGPLAAADYNGDGKIDLFVGGRFIPGGYPLNATSRLYKNVDGKFVLDTANEATFQKIGMVTSAVFCDYDNDHDPDLICTTEWGTLKVFRNDHGIFHDVTKQLGLDKYSGWWQGVATGDFNNDGRMDIVATNMGLNSVYKTNFKHPIRLYYGDYNGDHRIDIIDSFYDESLKGYVPRLRVNAFQSVPVITRNAHSNNRLFSRSTIKNIMGSYAAYAHYKEINTLQNMVFINNGKTFTAHPLPRLAQLSSANYVGVADVNNDGNEDIFLSQNFFDLRPKIPRIDSGRGLWLEGDGKGYFKVISGNVSGIKVYGDQRGAALGDFNNDGKVDLAISQNGGPVKLYLNQIKKRGYRIRLVGPEHNEDGIGSSIRLVYSDGTKGPRREIQSGSGYWSQNSYVQVMGAAKKVIAIDVNWFDGTKQQIQIKQSTMDYVVHYASKQ